MAKLNKGNSFAQTTDKTLKENNEKKRWIYLVIAVVVAIILILYIGGYIYACNHEQKSAWFQYYSERITSVPGLLTGTATAVFGVNFKSKSELLKVLKMFCGVVILVSLFAHGFGGIMYIISEVEKNPTTVVIDNGDEKLGDNTGKYELKQYVFEDDPFIEQVHEYLGIEEGTTSSEQLIDGMVEVIKKELEHQKRIANPTDEGIPQVYTDSIAVAELQYETYKVQRSRDWSVSTSYVIFLIDIRLADLQEAISYRIKGDKFHIDFGNRRIIALYFKDKGDEYIKKAEQYVKTEDAINHSDTLEVAQQAYENGAEWCMKAIHVAVIEESEKKAKAALKVFKKIEEAAANSKISNAYMAYDEAVGEYF